MQHGLVYRSLRARFTDCATRPVAQGVDAGVDDSQAAAGPSQISRICPSFRGSTSPRGCCLNTFFLKAQLCPAMRSPSCLLQEDIRLLCPDAVPSWGLSGRTDQWREKSCLCTRGRGAHGSSQPAPPAARGARARPACPRRWAHHGSTRCQHSPLLSSCSRTALLRVLVGVPGIPLPDGSCRPPGLISSPLWVGPGLSPSLWAPG